ncbi:MAG: hypothetical protein R3C44_00320 [Chloroflexota bacterium]
MSDEDMRRLVQLVPALGKLPDEGLAGANVRQQAAIRELKREISAGLQGEAIAPDEPFLNDLTLDEYLALPEDERARLWDSWTTDDEAWEEVHARPNAVLSR